MLYTCFNDYNGELTTDNPSSGIALLLDIPANSTKSLEPVYNLLDPSNPLVAYAEGSHTILDNGNRFMGYGVVPFMKEFGPPSGNGSNDTDVRYSAQFAYNNYNNTGSSYRAFKSVWHATPSAPLDLVVASAASNDTLSSCSGGSKYRGYVSWNGATDVTQYRIYAGSSASSLSSTGVVFDKKGFETEFVVPGNAKYVQVAALEGETEVGKSAAVAV